jgi:hypothetical protein
VLSNTGKRSSILPIDELYFDCAGHVNCTSERTGDDGQVVVVTLDLCITAPGGQNGDADQTAVSGLTADDAVRRLDTFLSVLEIAARVVYGDQTRVIKKGRVCLPARVSEHGVVSSSKKVGTSDKEEILPSKTHITYEYF